MGQYHLTINLDKREYLSPHVLGDGLKLVEQGLSGPGGIPTALHVLLAVSNGRGGGDYNSGIEYRFEDGEGKRVETEVRPLAEAVVGRWGGDRIAIVGDYAEDGDLPEGFAPIAYALCNPADEVQAQIDWAVEGANLEFAAQLRAQLETSGPFTDIAPMVRDYLVNCDAYYHTFSYGDGKGWVDRNFEMKRRAGV